MILVNIENKLYERKVIKVTPLDLKNISTNTKEKKPIRNFQDLFNSNIKAMDEMDFDLIVHILEKTIAGYKENTSCKECLALIEFVRTIQDARYQ